MNCPECNTTMEETPLKDSVLDSCPKCGGMWFNYGEMGAIKSLTEKEIELRNANKKFIQSEHDDSLECPHCKVPLKKTQYAYSSGIWIDRCNECKGVYVDHGELERLHEYFSNMDEWDDEIAALQPAMLQAKVDVELRYEQLEKEIDDLYHMDDLHRSDGRKKLMKKVKDMFFIRRYL